MGNPATKKKEEEPEKLDVPIVDLERIRDTYAELKRMQVKLDPNPIEYGPKRFNNRIAAVRAMLNRVDQVFLQVSEDLHLFKRIINAKRTLYEFEKRELMVNDTRVRVGRSQAEREALADVQMRDTLEDLAELERAAHDLETLMISIKSKRTDLKDAQGRMRDQMKMIEHDISMGARWGDKIATTPVSSVSAQGEDLDSMIAGVNSSLGIVDEDDEEEDEADDETEDSDEDGEDEEEEEEEEVVADDAKHDPSPHAEDPVLIFGETGLSEEEEDDDEKMESKEDESDDIEKLLPGDDEDGELPEDTSSSEDVDSFLESIGDEDEAEDEEEDEDDVSGIDDLIASLADDD
jgi:hypothetical protein